jgi:hypothetical protein
MIELASGFGLQLSVALLAVSFSLSAIEEKKVASYIFDKGGLNSTAVEYSGIQSAFSFDMKLNPILQQLYSKVSFYNLVLARAASVLVALFALTSSNAVLATVMLTFTLLVNVLVALRSLYGVDGTFHMSMIVLPVQIFMAVSYHALPTQIILMYFFIQMGLCYFFAGFIKLFGSEWRDGSCLEGVFSTEAYGHPLAQRLFRYRTIAFVSAWCVILLELYLSIAPYLGELAFVIALALGVTLHLSIAITMGLNKFFWTWMSAYPLWILAFWEVHVFL